jgi:peptidoglycan hydrolase FlgJ
MAINPGSDLLIDALQAAEPQQAKAAAGRLSSLAVDNGSTAAAFNEAMAAESTGLQGAASKGPFKVTVRSQATVIPKSAHPYRQFEATMLKSFFDMMLPHDAKAVYGKGLAGDVWRSMLAESLATTVANGQGVGVARELEARARRTKS